MATPFTCTINLQIQRIGPLSVGSHFEAHLTLRSWFSHQHSWIFSLVSMSPCLTPTTLVQLQVKQVTTILLSQKKIVVQSSASILIIASRVLCLLKTGLILIIFYKFINFLFSKSSIWCMIEEGKFICLTRFKILIQILGC